MHGLAAARLGYSDLALDYFRHAAAIDLADTHAAVDGGVHIAALGGIWQMAVRGFAGLSPRDDGIALDPRLPAAWASLGFRIQWRGRRIKIGIDGTTRRVAATLEAGAAMTVTVGGEAHELRDIGTIRAFAAAPRTA
jgi:trehalose/maltose hydrolase-like predicted phosphorylase